LRVVATVYFLVAKTMSSVITSVERSSRAIRASPLMSQVLKKSISTQELDATKGGKLATLTVICKQLTQHQTVKELSY
jgi:hypothetical protein